MASAFVCALGDLWMPEARKLRDAALTSLQSGLPLKFPLTPGLKRCSAPKPFPGSKLFPLGRFFTRTMLTLVTLVSDANRPLLTRFLPYLQLPARLQIIINVATLASRHRTLPARFTARLFSCFFPEKCEPSVAISTLNFWFDENHTNSNVHRASWSV